MQNINQNNPREAAAQYEKKEWQTPKLEILNKNRTEGGTSAPAVYETAIYSFNAAFSK